MTSNRLEGRAQSEFKKTDLKMVQKNILAAAEID